MKPLVLFTQNSSVGWRADHDRRHVHLPAAGQVWTAQAGGVLRLPHHCDGCQLWIRGNYVCFVVE